MKRKHIFIAIIVITLILLVPIKAQKDTIIHKNTSSKDTTLIKLTNCEVSEDSWNVIFPYIIGGLITGIFTLGAVFLTLRHQKKIAQAQIDAGTKQKFIDDILEIIKRIRLILFETFDISHEVLKNIPQNNISPEEGEQIRKKIDKAITEMWHKTLEFYYWSGSVFMYLSKSNSEYENIRKLTNKLSKSYKFYIDYFNGINIPTKERENKYGDILVERADRLMTKLQEIIDAERENINSIND